MPTPEASISKMKGWEKYSNLRIGASAIVVYRRWNAIWAAGVHWNESFFKRSVRGWALVA